VWFPVDDTGDAQHRGFTDACDSLEFLSTMGEVVPQAVIDTLESQDAEGTIR
jgi:hypothetical protein